MHLTEGTVTSIISERSGLQKVRVQRDDEGAGNDAYVLTDHIGRVAAGHRVVLNVTAVELGLGTGGWHFVHWNLDRHEFNRPGPGHIMKLRYTSLQMDTGCVEELPAYETPPNLDGMPVVGCLLISQVAAVAVAYKAIQPTKRVFLVVTDQNALPVVLSDLIHALKAKGLVETVISSGQAFGGDLESMNTMSALGVAKARGADCVIVANGHGSAGTGTPLGFSALGLAGDLDDATIYGGHSILCVRFSEADQRERHNGLSHHCATIMDRVMPLTVALPSGADLRHDRHDLSLADVPDIGRLFDTNDLDVTTMGRPYDDDRSFFQYSGAAGVVAAKATQ